MTTNRTQASAVQADADVGTGRTVGKPGRRPSKLRPFSGVWYVMPSLVVIAVVIVTPILLSAYYSLTDYSLLRSPSWVGPDNYRTLLSDGAFRQAMWQTLVYTFISVPLQTVLALVIAAMVARRTRHRFGAFVRSALFIPVIASMVIVGSVWRYLLATDHGLVNTVLGVAGIDNVNWLGQPVTALVVVSLVTVWKNIGYFLVIYYAGMLAIPNEIYEASSIDGAGGIRQFWSITIPSLRPVTLLVVILGTIWSFQVFDLVYTMTAGGPGGGTVTLVMAIYGAAFQNMQMGYASAMAMVLFVIVFLVSFAQRVLLNRK
ncbi:carbohydrate ABC transporter permease [Phytoactinopolyspora mesophila]|uniref:ABC transporter permease subunit n=1 Tax=Phytoactinopolyspora mesophila TaxID=2650750 RepID=A0A7K3M8C2_9ACTN|nr:sugar ABC transporter permease [Phytoactinopolyspora mesophila]NDL59212.1 ABC transporter permease subunit [Phytoactinopolyspora mesophila]